MSSPRMQVGHLEGTFLRIRVWRSRKITLRMGPALETLNTLQGPQNDSACYEAVLPLLRPGGLLVAGQVRDGMMLVLER